VANDPLSDRESKFSTAAQPQASTSFAADAEKLAPGRGFLSVGKARASRTSLPRDDGAGQREGASGAPDLMRSLQAQQAGLLRDILQDAPRTIPGPTSAHRTWAARVAKLRRGGPAPAVPARIPGAEEARAAVAEATGLALR